MTSDLRIWAVATAWLLLACGDGPELELPAADAALENPRGLSRLSKSAMDAFLGANAAWGSNSGYVAVFARDGVVAHATTSGYADLASNRPMRLQTHFRIASMTKPVTAVAALILIEEGRLRLDDPVSRYVPIAARLRVATASKRDAGGEIPTEALERELTVRHLLTFSSGIGSRGDDSDLGRLWAERDIYAGAGSLEDRVDRILTAPLHEQPGERWRYGWSADVLARVVEVTAGQPFDQFLRQRIFEPLGMSSTSFLSGVKSGADVATMYTQDEDRELVVVDAPASDAFDWTPGGSGLVSTAPDYLRFALMLWNRGEYDGARILSAETVAQMTTPHVRSGVLASEGIEGLGWGLGLAVVVDADATPTIDRNGDFWWAGYYGTTFFVSPETGVTGVVLSQNQPGPHSRTPFAVHLAGAFALWGL